MIKLRAPRLRRPHLLKVVALAAATMAVASLTAAPADAATKRYSTKYTISATVRSAELKTCFAVTAEGRISANGAPYKQGFFWSKEQLDNPTLRLVAFNCTNGKAIKLSKVKIEQRWYDTGCHTDVQIGVGFPWAVSVGVTPDCGKEEIAHRQTTYTKKSSVVQYNSGAPVLFKGRDSGRWCTRPIVSFTAYRGGESDTFTLKNLNKACIKRK